MLINVTVDTEGGDHNTQMDEPMPDPTTRERNNAPTEPTIVTQTKEDNAWIHTPTAQGEEENMEIHERADQSSEALTNVTPCPDQDIRAEPNVHDILNDE